MSRKAWTHTRPSRHARGLGNDWQRVRSLVMRRDMHLCQPCKLAGRLTPATECDHILPRSQGGTNDPANAQAICAACHLAKSAAEMGRRPPGAGAFDAAGRPIWDR